MTTPTIYEHACHIIAAFDFQKVRRMMEATDWRWGGPYMNGDYAVPPISAMQAQTMQLILEAHRTDCNVASGGFEAYWIRAGESSSCGYKGAGCIGLRFVAACCY